MVVDHSRVGPGRADSVEADLNEMTHGLAEFQKFLGTGNLRHVALGNVFLQPGQVGCQCGSVPGEKNKGNVISLTAEGNGEKLSIDFYFAKTQVLLLNPLMRNQSILNLLFLS